MNIKKITLPLLLTLASVNAYADDIQSVFTVGVASGTENDAGNRLIQASLGDPAYYIGWVGKFNAEPGGIGVYASLGIPEHKITGVSADDNHFNLLNAGGIYSFSQEFQVYGGLGYAHQVYTDSANSIGERNKNYLNVNTGFLYRFGRDDRFGINISYDTAPKAFGFSLVYPF
ncbi:MULTISPECIES: hypothetical protein [Gammaproteobacteria]|uniref:hypothetical protein n=1 Tax=Gammaproteobacteria TaxID=1236 RepID=UPI000DD07F5B|nr:MULTISPECIES: hypothetical protein [Gammaproteobacteria]RTE87375.1 hypothetical protein DQX04_03030 [Aliidiomarina sp. B3213]TCZ92839.1 hypothetical protein EYQ95_02275 [Lysobacter sp. N42]